jgi:Ni/Co efflux regulator RcnB
MKKLFTAIVAGALIATSPAWAHGGHGHGKHAHKEWRKAQKHWAKHHKHHRHHIDHVVVHQYVSAPPAVVHRHVVHERVVVAPPAPPPGVHIALPNIYIPF